MISWYSHLSDLFGFNDIINIIKINEFEENSKHWTIKK